jgi:3-hydroxyacyl-CoA dehydrogenase
MSIVAKVRTETDGSVLVVIIENPPINAGSMEVRQGLNDAIIELERNERLGAAVLIGGGSTFIAGSDLREFGKPLESPQLPDLIAAIEMCPKPVVAALHGAALGGGLELALGCDGRIAETGAILGLPEVTLGMIPGAGGTQRLPRLVGIPRAIRMICSGERISAREALELGIVDVLTDTELRAAAVKLATSFVGRKFRLRDRPVPSWHTADAEAASAQALREGRRRPQVAHAIRAIMNSAALPIDEALAAERAVFQELRVSREASALRHQFFAERQAMRQPTLAGVNPRPVCEVAIVGAGTMGSGIAIAALDAGYSVTLLDSNDAALERGTTLIAGHYRKRVAAGKLAAAVAQERSSRLLAGLDWKAAQTADLVIEAVFEDLDVKRSVLHRLDALVKPGALLATNTSYLDIDAIAAATSRPEDVLGLHFFSPAHVMKLLEVVQGAKTAPDALATAFGVARRLRKVPILARNAFGFVGNRVFAAYRRQCEFMLEEGADPKQVDDALQDFGFAMGPFAVADLSGLDIAWKMRQATTSTRDPAARYVDIPDLLCMRGRLGRKTGAGYYRYDDGAKPIVDPVVLDLIESASSAKAIERRSLSKEEIQRRALLAMANEAALLSAEGVASSPFDVDVALVNGYGFPRWEGGPVFWAQQRGPAALKDDIKWLAELSGKGFIPGDVSILFGAR